MGNLSDDDISRSLVTRLVTRDGHTSRTAIIIATGYWNGSKRTLYWSEVLPGCGGWSSESERARCYDPASGALGDLEQAKAQMRNPALEVFMVDPERTKGER